MDSISRRHMLAATATGGLLTSVGLAHAQTPGSAIPQPQRPGHGGTDPGPRNLVRDRQNPDLLVPPSTDHGTLPNLRFSFSDAHVRLEPGGWTRQVTQRELGIAKSMAGVNMRLNAGGVRELHWHKASEWAYMLYGTARVTAVDSEGRYFVDDVGVGDLWFFPGGTPHSIQGLGPDGCEFLLVFDDGDFDEDNTFLLNDWFKRIPTDVLGKNFGVPASLFGHTPDESERYIFLAPLPGPLGSEAISGAKASETSYTWRMMEQVPIKTKSGTVRITDSRLFPISTTTAAALVEVEPGGLREVHWHPNGDEWLYVIEGQARMGVFAGQGQARTFDLQAGDVGYVPVAMGHYLENTGSTNFRFLETFKSDRFIDFSLDTWMAATPPGLVQAHLKLDPKVMSALRTNKALVVPE
ncbi:oxalate decarboxylase [Bradyrhizobium japonicum]|uniref:Oxalate decarboxylase n=1 Tax=Bradyrhizobium japonicum TaxID=375 RepID=A0A0A3XS04_BRAJP|nr:cupin domain-containing protein [Bradyrhizobium japonicum]KGT75926.1 oxalate decarboxylase [Bradyrhizobium japonicum]MCS3897443.1 oxalate decarboxylase [Bradyrhizobium japonicum USDA 38]MCS3949958.1 oxalate decarboxylase [Bradyrhizobium japonicum]